MGGRSGHRDGMASAPDRYVPAAGRAWLTGSYDRTVALTMRERAWRPAVVRAVASEMPIGATAVEIGCGTGSLSLDLAAARPDAEIVGVDGDPEVLALARRKHGAGDVRWVEGLAGALPLADDSAQAVLCSLFLHHLTDHGKASALTEAARVLAPGGVLHIADWGPPRGPAAALGARALQIFDGREGPTSLLAGALPALLTGADFKSPRRLGALRTVWGTLEFWRASAGEPALVDAPFPVRPDTGDGHTVDVRR